jgi:Mor family transcriptional regulator
LKIEFKRGLCFNREQSGRSKALRYLKAKDVLPEEIIELIQEYVDGDYLYIPRKDGKQKAWGESSGIRESLRERNRQIYKKYSEGASVDELIRTCYLSEQSIRRILRQEKERFSSSLQNRL